jgi:Kef-type K+ transport system membrane component KefB
MNLFQSRASENRLPKLIKKVFSYLMICVYLAFGLFVLINGWYALTKTQSIVTGTLLILYSIFRIYRVVRESGQKDTSDELTDNSENE